MGAKIRQLRKEQGLTLEQLAERVGVTRSFVSQVENDLSNPSIQTLRNVADALGVPLFALFQPEPDGRVVVRKDGRVRIRRAESDVEFQLLSPDLSRSLEVVWVEIPVGGATSPKPRAHQGEECNVILSGRALMEVGNESFDLRPGDSIYLKCDIPHRTVNVGRSVVRMISAITPPSF